MEPQSPKLLSRDEFRARVFERDSNKCILCSEHAADSHHILDRALWDDGGYYLENGVSLCPSHHLEAEKTLISCDQLREAAHITVVHQPEHFYVTDNYDHWGNIILPNGTLLKGEMFGNESVQKILKEAGVLDQFSKHVKYPRTYHLAWSENLQNDDRKHEDINFLLNKEIIASIKIDGEGTTFYDDFMHARSLTSGPHPSRSWVKALHGSIAHNIPENWRVCGENVYAKHSIYYEHLKSYFYVFSIWNENNIALSWNETQEYAELFGLITVPVFCRGVFKTVEELRQNIESCLKTYSETNKDEIEGYVIRVTDPISYKNFRKCTAKFVRKNHVQSPENWMTQPVIPNKIEV